MALGAAWRIMKPVPDSANHKPPVMLTVVGFCKKCKRPKIEHAVGEIDESLVKRCLCPKTS